MADGKKKPVVRDIRRYICEFCGICRSKKSLIASHVLSHHKDEAEANKNDLGEDGQHPFSHDCQECGACFRKPAHLKQHMQSHSLERPFCCPLDDCHARYRRKDHLNRHLLGHEGKLFTCPIENCNRKFAFQGNMKRHVKELHEEGFDVLSPKVYVCTESGCGKTFKFASKLKKHKLSHVNLEYAEVICNEPECMKHFSNAKCLQAHVRTVHKYVQCEVCSSPQLKKNLKRHMQTHEEDVDAEVIHCHLSDCDSTFSSMSNLKIHVKAVHLNLRPFTCGVSGCEKTFSYKHVRDNHVKSGAHVCIQGDFLEADRQFQSRSRGGRKRKAVDIGILTRKGVVPPGHGLESVFGTGAEYLRRMLSEDD